MSIQINRTSLNGEYSAMKDQKTVWEGPNVMWKGLKSMQKGPMLMLSESPGLDLYCYQVSKESVKNCPIGKHLKFWSRPALLPSFKGIG